MHVGNRDTAYDGTDDADEALIGSTKEKIFQVRLYHRVVCPERHRRLHYRAM